MSEQNGHPEKARPSGGNNPQADAKSEDSLDTMSEEELLAAIDGETEEDAPEKEGKGFSNPLEALAAENHKLDEEIAGLKDQLLRSAAEMENLRRRTQKDVADARSFSIAGFARDILSVADNLRRAIDHVEEKDREQPGIKSLIEGVEITERELLGILEKHGVKQISPLNEKFNPDLHQAMFEVQNPEVPHNTVCEVAQVGYVIGERSLRPAMVGVAKGGPKVSAESAEEQSGEEAEQETPKATS